MKVLDSLVAAIRRGRTVLPLRFSISMMDASERYSYKPTLSWNPEVEDYFVQAYGADHFACISNALMRPSCYSCIRVNTLKSTSDAVIEKLLCIIQKAGLGNGVEGCNISNDDVTDNSNMGQEQINFWTGASTRTSEDICSSKENIQSHAIYKCQVPGLDYVVFVRGSGPHTIEYGFGLEKPPKEVIVSRKCAEAVLRGAQVYVPGVLACSGHVEKGDVVAVSVAVEQPTVDGGWGVGMTRGTVLQGCQTDPLYIERSGLYIGQGITMMSRAGMFRIPEGVAIDMNQRIYNLPSFHGVLEGEIFLQNLPSIITAHALDPQPGERILDMCAAPGGKTTAIAILMKDEGEVVAVDRSHNKVVGIENLAVEMGLSCIRTYKLDALKAVFHPQESVDSRNQSHGNDSSCEPIESADSLRLEKENGFDSNFTEGSNADLACMRNEENSRRYTSKAEIRKKIRRQRNGPGRNQCIGGRVINSKGFSPNSFDRVLLDAPCSALGLRPRLFAGEETVESLRKHSKYQRRMFDQAVQLVRPGGVLVYSTCTVNPGENEALVRYALDKYKFLSLASQRPRIGGPGLVGSCSFADGYVEEWLQPGEEELVQRFDPSSPLDTIGFFIAKFCVSNKDV